LGAVVRIKYGQLSAVDGPFVEILIDAAFQDPRILPPHARLMA
jgi:hypothetical protein